MSAPRSRKPTPEEIYRELRERIVLLDLPPGAHLKETVLAEEFGVSRTPIRQVLDQLEHEQLVDQHPGSAATVAVLDTKQLRDVWAVRMKIAELMDEFVHLPATGDLPDRVREIRDQLDDVRERRDLRALGALYNRFHEAMLTVVSNATLRRIHDELYHQTARVWLQFLPEMDVDTEIDIVAAEIDDVLEAIEARDGHRLVEVRAKHLTMLLARFNDHVAGPR